MLTPDQIKRWATEHNLTIEELCDRAGISTSAYHSWLSRKHHMSTRLERMLLDVMHDVPRTNDLRNKDRIVVAYWLDEQGINSFPDKEDPGKLECVINGIVVDIIVRA